MVMNLLSNAVKFTPRGPPALRRSWCASGRALDPVVDDGAGIAPEFLPHVFNRFRQQDDGITGASTRVSGWASQSCTTSWSCTAGASRRKSGGVRARAPGSRSSADSRGGRGGGRRAAAQSVVDASSTAIAGLRILVVDDDLDARDLLAIALEGHGAARAHGAVGRRGAEAPRSRSRFDVLVARHRHA